MVLPPVLDGAKLFLDPNVQREKIQKFLLVSVPGPVGQPIVTGTIVQLGVASDFQEKLVRSLPVDKLARPLTCQMESRV
jgi:hypothetical protein